MSPEFLDRLHAAAQGAKIWTVNLDRRCPLDNSCWCDKKLVKAWLGKNNTAVHSVHFLKKKQPTLLGIAFVSLLVWFFFWYQASLPATFCNLSLTTEYSLSAKLQFLLKSNSDFNSHNDSQQHFFKITIDMNFLMYFYTSQNSVVCIILSIILSLLYHREMIKSNTICFSLSSSIEFLSK